MTTSALKLCVRRTERQDAAVEVSVRVPSEIDCIEEVVELLARHCFAGARPSGRSQFRFRVATSEALANAVICGNALDPAKSVFVRAECLSDCIRIHVTDEGRGFDPAAVPEPIRPEDVESQCGRGLFLIRHLVDDVAFNPRGNSICMTLRRP